MTSTPITVTTMQVGLPQALGQEDAPDPMDRPWRTSFFKQPVAGPLWLGATNLEGDGQADLKNHGGVDKAVMVLSSASGMPSTARQKNEGRRMKGDSRTHKGFRLSK